MSEKPAASSSEGPATVSVVVEGAPGPSPETTQTLDFLLRLGRAYLASGEQTALVELFLRRVATASGMRHTRVVAFPTAIFISTHDGTRELVTLSEGPLQTLRLAQMADVYTLGDAAQSGRIAPSDGLVALSEILARPARFGPIGTITGHVVLSVGLVLLIGPTLPNIWAVAILGAVVGLLKAFSRNQPILNAPLSVVAAAVVSILTFVGVRYDLPIDPLYVLVPPLVTFLPGGMLTFGMVELAYGDMVSGASRLMTGFVQLVLLAFALAGGAAVVGVRSEDLLHATGTLLQSPWLPWVGATVFGLGVYMHFSAPRGSLPWLLLVLVTAFGSQRLAGQQFGPEVSGFFGMLIATPLGYFIQQKFHGPPAIVTFLPSFWILVPGSLSLLSVTRLLSDRAAGLDGLVTAVFAFASIALGTLVGASLYKWLTEAFGLWYLQIGRVGSLFRRAK